MNRRQQVLLGALVAVALYAIMDASIRDTSDWQGQADEPVSSAEQLDALTTGLFDTHVLSLEVLGVLLTAAMIGALVLARPLGAKPDSDNYRKTTRDEMRQSMHASTLEANK